MSERLSTIFARALGLAPFLLGSLPVACGSAGESLSTTNEYSRTACCAPGPACEPNAVQSVAPRCAQVGCDVSNGGQRGGCPVPPPEPRGAGLWIWSFQGGADPAPVVAARLQSLGVGFVLINSSYRDGSRYRHWGTNFNPKIVREFTSRGIDVYGWTWIDPVDVTPQGIAEAVEQANVEGALGLVLDVEWP